MMLGLGRDPLFWDRRGMRSIVGRAVEIMGLSLPPKVMNGIKGI